MGEWDGNRQKEEKKTWWKDKLSLINVDYTFSIHPLFFLVLPLFSIQLVLKFCVEWVRRNKIKVFILSWKALNGKAIKRNIYLCVVVNISHSRNVRVFFNHTWHIIALEWGKNHFLLSFSLMFDIISFKIHCNILYDLSYRTNDEGFPSSQLSF